jgi:hypothetical protein
LGKFSLKEAGKEISSLKVKPASKRTTMARYQV